MGEGRPSQGSEDNDTYIINNPDTMVLGESVGTQYHKLTKDECAVPDHTHSVRMDSGGACSDSGFDGTPNGACSSKDITGGGKDATNAHYNISPSLVLIYAIRILK